MPYQYPQSSPYNPYQEVKKPKNWPMIILITLGIIVLIAALVFIFIIRNVGDVLPDSDLNDSDGEGIAIGEPNPNGYDCSKDVYNCGNFTTQSEAQVAFDSCFSTAGDVWRLDNDGDGKVCEGMG